MCAATTPHRVRTKSISAGSVVTSKRSNDLSVVKSAAGNTAPGAGGSVVGGASENPSEDEQEMQRYLESRSKLLQKLLIVMLWCVLKHLNAYEVHVQQRTLEIISYYSKEVLQYLTACDHDNCGSWIVNVVDLSLGLPMAVHRIDSLELLGDVDGKSIRVSACLSCNDVY